MTRLYWKRLFHMPIYRNDILRCALSHYHSSGLCYAIRESLRTAGVVDTVAYRHLRVYFPLFTEKNSRRFNRDDFNARYFTEGYWFPKYDWVRRREFVLWLMERYKNDKTDLRTISI